MGMLVLCPQTFAGVRVHCFGGGVCFDRGMSKPLRVRRLTDHEGHQLQRIVRRGGGMSKNSVVRWRRAMVVLASAGGNTVPAIARLVSTSPDRVREMIHRFNETAMASLDPQWPLAVPAGSRRQMRTSPSRRPRRARRRWGWLSRGGVCATWPAISATTTTGRCRSVPSGCARSCAAMTSRSSGPRRGRSPKIPTATPSWTASRRRSSATLSGVSPSTSSGRAAVRAPRRWLRVGA